MISLILASFIAVNTLTPRPVLVREKAASMAANAVAATKQDGVIQTLGTNSFTINGITVNIVSNTVLLRKFGAKATFNEFSVGDQIQVLGKWTDSNKTAINARVVRNLSVQKRHGTFLGTVVSTSINSFVLKPVSRTQQTVTVNDKTQYFDRKNKTIKFTDLTAGHKVMAKGLWDNKLNTLTEVSVVRDFSLPVKPEVTPGQTITPPLQSGSER